MKELRDLPESDQSAVLSFLQALKQKHRGEPAAFPRQTRNPALKLIDGALVFTGEVNDSTADWVQIVRDEREAEILRRAQAGNAERP